MCNMKFVTIAIAALALVSMSACGKNREMALVNEQSISTADIQRILVDYDKDDITIYDSPSDQIIVKEYMDIDKSSYYARIKNKDGELTIGEGQRPGGDKLGCYIEMYLPVGLRADVCIHVTNSNIETQITQPMATLRFETTQGNLDLSNVEANNLFVASANGTVNLNGITADTITLKTGNATVDMTNVDGIIDYTTTNGKLTVQGASGYGSYSASADGTLDISYREITGDICAFTHNSNILFTAPADAAFNFTANSKNGNVQVDYAGITVSGGAAGGSVGSNPQHTVKLQARNGDIEAK